MPGIQHPFAEDGFGALQSADADDKCVFVDLRNCIARGTALATTPTSREMGLDRVVDRDASCELYMVEDQHA